MIIVAIFTGRRQATAFYFYQIHSKAVVTH